MLGLLLGCSPRSAGQPPPPPDDLATTGTAAVLDAATAPATAPFGRDSPRPAVPPAAAPFVAWLAEHPEVRVASLLADTPIARLRYSDATGTIVGAVHQGRAVCIRHPEPVRNSWGLRYRRRTNAAPLRAIVVGPGLNDPQHGAAYEFRFPEGTVHLRRPQPLRYRADRPFIAYDSEGPAAPAGSPALPTVPCPPWATAESLNIGHVNSHSHDPAILNIDPGHGEQIVCHHAGAAWRCLPPLTIPKLAEAEPAVPAQDHRLPQESSPWLVDGLVSCAVSSDCLLVLEWAWYRERIAHTYRWQGSFLTIYRADGNGIYPRGRLRIRMRAADNGGRHFLGHLGLSRLPGPCFKLSPVPPPANLWPDAAMKPPPVKSPYALPPVGEYCLSPSGLCLRDGDGQDSSGLPGCTR